MSGFFSKIIDSTFGAKTRREHLARIEQSIEIAKTGIEAEKEDISVGARKDQEALQKRIEDERAAPKKHKAQERKWTEDLEKYHTEKKERRLKDLDDNLKLLESVRDNWRGKPKG